MLRKIHEENKGGKTTSKKKKRDGRRFKSDKLDMTFRSSWEVELAELMTDLEIEFKYEPFRYYYRAERTSYLPDFYLPQYNIYIEVKGYMDNLSAKRCRLFRKYQLCDFGFFLYMAEERKLILEDANLLFTYLEIASQEHLIVKAMEDY